MEEHSAKPKTTPKDFFVYLGILVSLYVAAGSLLALLFAIVNARFADPLAYYSFQGMSSSLTFAISALLVSVPLYLVLSWHVRKEITRDPQKTLVPVRRWFVWLTLFAAGLIVAGDVVALIHTFLQGELTTRFVLKMLSVLVVSGGVFWYYFYDMRNPDRTASKLLVAVPALFVLAAIGVGFAVVGSPAEQRAMRFDDRRESDLSSIQWQILSHWQATSELPATLAEVADDFSGYQVPSDPETGEPYEYIKTGELSFDICATFTTSDDASSSDAYYPHAIEYAGFEGNFAHDAGRTCFSRTIDPLIHSPQLRR